MYAKVTWKPVPKASKGKHATEFAGEVYLDLWAETGQLWSVSMHYFMPAVYQNPYGGKAAQHAI